ncbi:rhodanese-related sulfurtransferase [Enterococcus sp. PF1-24]|uniref:rhodanese-like domain-containing protein n=1 Tax=unclassified Enterococcus TaxID=2608891 RepID=UPI002475E468|nr:MULTISPECIES: rhodanese-like domain-containing protein [unclassified Enterococcus]MDH6365166.1 rhodanese-related sulfurtransferase [Enterococcus sp. PFB1-1]MDH6402250.1 rhodanese-related sulfurtransferase [Enterococcus sp. PF1-24]
MYQEISCEDFRVKNQQEKLTVLDIREVDEVQTGAIPNAKNIPLSRFPQAVAELNKDQKYYLICHSGSRSHMLGNYLTEAGYDVVNVLGGMMAWSGEVI